MSPPTPIPTERARGNGLESRRALGSAARSELSSRTCRRLMELEAISTAHTVGGYDALGEELDLAPLHAALHSRGTQLFLPRVDGQSMEFVRWRPGQQLNQNRFGIGEPVGEPVEPTSLDVILLPCVAVDTAGTRVGFGAGYYDRALAGLGAELPQRPLLVGVAFDVQCLEPIERRDWDVPVDVVVTDAHIHWVNGDRSG